MGTESAKIRVSVAGCNCQADDVRNGPVECSSAWRHADHDGRLEVLFLLELAVQARCNMRLEALAPRVLWTLRDEWQSSGQFGGAKAVSLERQSPVFLWEAGARTQPSLWLGLGARRPDGRRGVQYPCKLAVQV